ncbi:hypothetical protein RJT34_18109 [Clitoria ternatea]|uniref:Membrane-associated 30 kDa protein n=1 Tax=Clitoria ternatea TaxID=43366 RepID=A0AAN9PF41_CLITE
MAMAMKATPLSGSAFLSIRQPFNKTPFKSSFLSYASGALEVPGIRVSYTDRLKCNCQSGGALGARMNLFSRFARVIKSYANAIISAFEDPEKILEQAVLDMNNDLIKVRQATAQVLASQKQLESKYKAVQKASDDWYRRAHLALQKGDEDLAREAFKRRKSYADNATALKTQLEQQKSVADSLVSKTKLLEGKIEEAKSKKDTLKARAQSAKTSTIVSEMVSNISTSSGLAAFDKMEEKVSTMEAQADALNQLTTDNLEGKFALLENSSIDDDLAELKKEMSASSRRRELPPGRTVPTNQEFPFPDMEVEKEFNELRRKTKGF